MTRIIETKRGVNGPHIPDAQVIGADKFSVLIDRSSPEVPADLFTGTIESLTKLLDKSYGGQHYVRIIYYDKIHPVAKVDMEVEIELLLVPEWRIKCE